MTPEQVRDLAATVRGRLAGQRWNEGDTALTALTDELLRHLGAPRVPIRISRERLVEIEAACRVPRAPAIVVDQWNQVWVETEPGEPDEWRRHTVHLSRDGQMCQDQDGPFPTLRAALEAPVVRRAGCPPVVEFEVES